jgi:hypothetical protein
MIQNIVPGSGLDYLPFSDPGKMIQKSFFQCCGFRFGSTGFVIKLAPSWIRILYPVITDTDPVPDPAIVGVPILC